MAEFQSFDLGRILQTAESIKGIRRQAETDQLRNAYLGVQTQNAQADQQAQNAARAQAQQEHDARVKYLQTNAIIASPDPVAAVRQYAPDMIAEIEQQNGPGSFDKIPPDALVAHLKQIAPQLAAKAGIAPDQEKFGEPIDANYQGKPSKIQVGSKGTVRPVAGATPYNKPEKHAAGESFDPESAKNTAQMIASGQIPMLTGYALRTPWGQSVASQVKDLNPDYSAADYGSTAAALKMFTSGKTGNTVRSLNVAVQHLDQLGQLATALNNGDVQTFNRIGNSFAKETGNAAPTNFDTAKKIVADEIVKAIVGSGGGVADREQAANSINSAGSPAQLQQAIQTYQGLLTGQLNGLRQQYKESTKRDDFERFLLPETRSKLEAHDSAQPGQRLTPEQASQLPSGTQFVGMDGVTRVKH